MFHTLLLVVFLVSVVSALIGRQVLTHSIRKKQRQEQKCVQNNKPTPWRSWCEYIVQLVAFAFITYALAGHTVPGVFSNNDLLKALGTLFLVLGVIVHVRAKYDLGVNWTNAKDGPTVWNGPFTQEGLYGYSRNPMYTGTLITVFGVVLMTQNLFVTGFWGVLYVYFLYVIRSEELLLHEEKGWKYVAYCSRVRRFL